MREFDVVVIGAGVVGALAARALTKYDISVGILERGNDAASGATRSNSAIVHAGFDAKPGTLKAKLNVRGVELMEQVCGELSVPYWNNGSLVVAFSNQEMETLEVLKKRGETNGVEKLSVIDKVRLKELEPHISEEAVGALLAETAGLVCPYELAIAAVENAVTNGGEFIRGCEVQGIAQGDSSFVLDTTAGKIKAKYIINAAGVRSGLVAQMIGDDSIDIVVRHGDYYLLDRGVGDLVTYTIFQCPSEMGKGVLVAPTVEGTLIVGPSANDIDDFDDTATTPEGLRFVLENAQRSIPEVSLRNAITSFSGNRAHPTTDDFIIGVSEKSSRFINAAGIESPGLTAAPAIAEMIEQIFLGIAEVSLKDNYNSRRPEPVRFRTMTSEQRRELIKRDPAYGRIICRCEMITEGEIRDAIRAPAGARDVDGVKRRTRAGMGRCQGGFCGPKVVEILARELNIQKEEITKFGGGSRVLGGRTQQGGNTDD